MSVIDQKDLAEICKRFEKENPNPKSELIYTNPFTFAVAVILSAQSTDKGVNKATPELFKIAGSPEEMLKLGLDGLKKYINTIGLYNNKAKSIIGLSEKLVEKYEGKLPREREELEKLPGIGKKTASVILNELYGVKYIAVDTHVIRLSERLNLVPEWIKDPNKISEELEKTVPDEYKNRISNWLVLHGRYVCKAKKPNCDKCLISDLCSSKDKLQILH